MSGTGTRARIAAGALLAAAAIAVAAILLGGDDDRYVVKAEFRDSAGLRKNSDVKVGGVPGGKISAIELTGRDTALVTMKLDDSTGPVGRGVRASARPANLLGEKYVELEPGDLRRPLPSGRTVGLARTRASVELDDVLNTLDPTTRGRLRIIINEFGVSLRGRGADFNALLTRMPPALDEAEELLGSFAADTARLKRLASQGDRVIGAFAAGRDDLTEMVDTAERTLKATAASRAELGATIDEAPGTLSQMRATLARIGGASRDLRPAARELRRSSAPLAATLQQLPGFAKHAAPALAAAERVAPTLKKLGDDGAPVIGRLAPVAGRLERFADEFGPFSAVLEQQANPMIRVFEGWARAIQSRDGIGHYLRVQAVPTPELLQHLAGKLTRPSQADTPRAKPRTPAKPDEPKAPKPPPAADPTPAPPETPAPPAIEPSKPTDALHDLLDALLR